MKHPVYYFVLSAFLIIADQLSKWAVMEHMIRPVVAARNDMYSPLSHSITQWLADTPPLLPYAEIEILPFFNIVMVWNYGVSFGLFNEVTDYGPLILIALSAIITVFFVIWMFTTHHITHRFGIALIIAGAIGNMIDRIRFGAVADFLDFHVMGWHWPAFNIADSCIVIGVFILIIYALFFEKNFERQGIIP